MGPQQYDGLQLQVLLPLLHEERDKCPFLHILFFAFQRFIGYFKLNCVTDLKYA
jgi:hypothetical protein